MSFGTPRPFRARSDAASYAWRRRQDGEYGMADGREVALRTCSRTIEA